MNENKNSERNSLEIKYFLRGKNEKKIMKIKIIRKTCEQFGQI